MLAEGPISWSSKKQSAIALSFTEAEYRGLLIQQLNVYGCRDYLESVASNLSTPIPSTLITRVPFESAKIQFRSREPNTLRFTCTTSESLCMMAPLTYSSVLLQNK